MVTIRFRTTSISTIRDSFGSPIQNINLLIGTEMNLIRLENSALYDPCKRAVLTDSPETWFSLSPYNYIILKHEDDIEW